MNRLGSSLRSLPDGLLQEPFWRLTAHFAGRLFAGSNDAGEGAINLGVGTMLALLASPGLFITVLLIGHYVSTVRQFHGFTYFDPYAQSLPDQYFFFAYSTALTGIVVALKWESIFPGRRDYMNLAPLPIPTRHILLANLLAIVVIALIFAIDINAGSAFLFPYLVMMERGTFHEYLRFTAAHLTGVLLCSLFIFFGLFALVGAMMAVLPSRIFHRLSLYIRVTVVIAMLALLYTSFAVPTLLRDLYHSHSWFLRVLPPIWFIGLVRSLIGKSDEQLYRLGIQGAYVMPVAMLVAATAYVVGYYRHFIRIPEQLETEIRARAPRRILPQRLVDRMLLRSPFERACYPFAFKTLARNDTQSLLFGGIAGLGLVVAAQTLVAGVNASRHSASGLNQLSGQSGGLPNSNLLAVPLILIFFVLCAVRFVFDLPAELQANWALQMIVDRDKHEAFPVARKIMLSMVWPGILLIALPLYAWLWGWVVAVGHTVVLLVWSLCLTDYLLRRFRKIPFTCARTAWHPNITALIVIYALGFAAFTSFTSEIEYGVLRRGPFYLWLMGPLSLGLFRLSLKFHEDEFDPKELIFEEAPAPAVELLNLTGRLPNS